MESEALILSFRQKLEVQRFAANTVKNYVDYARVFLKYMQRSSDKVILIRPSKGNKDRMVTLSERLLNLLRKYYLDIGLRNTYLRGEKGGMYSVRSVQLVFKKAMQAADIKSQGSVHSLRHSFATHLIEAGTDIRVVQELMGHGSVKTTMIYTHITDQMKRKTPSPLDFL